MFLRNSIGKRAGELCGRVLFDAFFFVSAGAKKKAWQKNAVSVGLCAPHPHHLLKKVDEN